MAKQYKSVVLIAIVGMLIVLLYRSFIAANTEITPAEAKQNKSKGLYDYIVDVRTDREWSEEHLADTIHISIGELVTELPKQIPDRSARILFICKKGVRASAVVVIAHKLGYKNVQSMIGNYKELL